jgi:hypothetical protein
MIIKESISFERGGDPKVTLGIGQRYIIEHWLDTYRIKDYKINDDYTISTKKDVDLHDIIMDHFPEYIRFGWIGGSFYLEDNNLTSLIGCPAVVTENFHCDWNYIDDLIGFPDKVRGNVYFRNHGKQFTREEIRKRCWVGGYISL